MIKPSNAPIVLCGDRSFLSVATDPRLRELAARNQQLTLLWCGYTAVQPCALAGTNLSLKSVSASAYAARARDDKAVDLSEPFEPLGTPRVLVTSIYDESNNARLDEYLYCVENNAQEFELLVLFYERRDSRFHRGILERLDEMARTKVVLIEISRRPTFESLFDAVDFLCPDALVFVANADIAYDATKNKLTAEQLSDSFCVLTRHEPDLDSGSGELYMRDHHGLPNTMSADTWIYRSPRAHRFRAAFGIGTYQCDSFLNYFIAMSGYQIFNPCLDIVTRHIHDASYNSSAEKAVVHSQAIEDNLVAETARNGGEAPLRGIEWCRAEDVGFEPAAGRELVWTNFIAYLDLGSEALQIDSAVAAGVMLGRVVERFDHRGALYLGLESTRWAEADFPQAVALQQRLAALLAVPVHLDFAADRTTAVFAQSPERFRRLNWSAQDLLRIYKDHAAHNVPYADGALRLIHAQAAGLDPSQLNDADQRHLGGLETAEVVNG